MNNVIDKDMKPLNSKGQRHGLWEFYWTDNNLSYRCVYQNGKEIGYEELYNWAWDYKGKINKKKYYI